MIKESYMNDIQISKNFKLSKFECSDGSQLVKLHENLLHKLQNLGMWYISLL